MFVRQLLTLFVVLGMHTSLCSGGVFALATSTVDSIVYAPEAVAPMSYGSIGYLSCKTSETDDELGMLDMGSCGSADECITQLSSRTHDLLSVSYSGRPHVAVPLVVSLTAETDLLPSAVLARAGPLYEDAHSFTKSLIKLE